jgi:hypothetical protein
MVVKFSQRDQRARIVQRRFNESPVPLDLSALLPDLSIYSNAVIVDPSPIMIPPGGALTNEYVVNTNYAAYAPMYDIYANNNGQPGDFVMDHIQVMNLTNVPGIGQLEMNTLDNYTVTNNAGQVANDFEAFIGGITNLNEITGYYTATNDPTYPGYPTVNAQLVPGGVVITWTGSQTLPGHYSHFGDGLIAGVNATPQALPAVAAYWTSNSTIIGDCPLPWLNYNTNYIGANLLQGIIFNPFPFNVWIQRRINFLPVPPNLEDLTVTSGIWTNASIIDTNCLQVAL